MTRVGPLRLAAVALVLAGAAGARAQTCDAACLRAATAKEFARFHAGPLDAPAPPGATVHRAWTSDSYGGLYPLVTFVRERSGATYVEVRLDAVRNDGRPSLRTPVSAATWVAADGLVCLHPRQGRVVTTAYSALAITSSEVCADDPQSFAARAFYALAVGADPACALLHKQEYEREALRLGRCLRLEGDRIAAAEVGNIVWSILLSNGTSLSRADRSPAEHYEWAEVLAPDAVLTTPEGVVTKDVAHRLPELYARASFRVGYSAVKASGDQASVTGWASGSEGQSAFVQTWRRGDDARWRLQAWRMAPFARAAPH